MTLSPDEQRRLGEINRTLAGDTELSAVAHLFAQPPAPPRPQHRSTPPAAAHQRGTVVAILAAVLTFGAGCVVSSEGGPGPITIGTLLVLCSAAILSTVLVRHRKRPGPGRTDDR